MVRFAMLATVILTAASSAGQPATRPDLVPALRNGGYVIVVRHAYSPREVPDERVANPDNVARERQLDAAGRAAAAAMGEAMRRLKIPIGMVLSSPAYRALETVRYARWPDPQPRAELGDRGQSMQGVTEADGAWLRRRVAQFASGTNTILVTHLPNLTRAFPGEASGIDDGDALIFGPDGKGGAVVVGRVRVGEWPRLR